MCVIFLFEKDLEKAEKTGSAGVFLRRDRAGRAAQVQAVRRGICGRVSGCLRVSGSLSWLPRAKRR